jgi:hypothetical protein
MSDKEKLKVCFVCDKGSSLFCHCINDIEKLKVHFVCDKCSSLFRH